MSTADELDKLAEKAFAAIASTNHAASKAIHDPKWVERGVASVRRELDVLGPLAPAGAAGLDYLDAHRDAIAGVSGDAFDSVVHHLALGQDAAAERAFLDWLSTKATPEDRARARLDAARGVVLEEDASRARWVEIRGLALGFLKVAAAAAVPILVEVVKGSLAGMVKQ